MKDLAVAFLWHLHQPYYTDPLTKTAPLPWVRLHATKGYYDMGVLLEEYPEVQATCNLTPSLLLQIQEQVQGTVTDDFLAHAVRPAADLTEPERVFILRHFFAANWDTMVRSHERYYWLLVHRDLHARQEDLAGIARRFSTQDFLDVQVWHNLAWFGHRAVARNPELRELLIKGGHFSESDKQIVLKIQRDIVSQIIPLYRRLQDRGQIELSTTPFYHPILPLLIDTDFARRSRPDCALPQRFAYPEDAEAQLRRAIDFHEALFGRRPLGLWPSEGSVCPELMPILSSLGIRWAATDEGVLARSVDHWRRDEQLYRPHRFQCEKEDVTLLFRDHDLSDAVGFIYSRNDPTSAAADLCGRLRAIAHRSPETRPVVAVILDGENPWEYYPDGGEGFLRRLYETLSRNESEGVRLCPVTPARDLETHPPQARLTRLHTGSWINADLKIWLGHAEDNDAWDRVRRTRRFLHWREQEGGVPPEELQAAWDELYAAEGSDWFWWYGDEFETDLKPLFDHLFRLHLGNVYRLLGAEVPEFLKLPVLLRQVFEVVVREPTALISPTLDGIVTNFYEWRGAGSVEGQPLLSAMHKEPERFRRLYFGFDLDRFYLRLDPNAPEESRSVISADVPERAQPPDDLEIHVHFIEPTPAKLVFPIGLADPPQYMFWRSQDGMEFLPVRTFDSICRKKIIELAVPFKDLDVHPGARVHLVVKVMKGDIELERHPQDRPLAFTVPDHTFEATMWRV